MVRSHGCLVQPEPMKVGDGMEGSPTMDSPRGRAFSKAAVDVNHPDCAEGTAV